MNGILRTAAAFAVAGLVGSGAQAAVTASFSPQTGVVTIVGSDADDVIVVGRTAAGHIWSTGGFSGGVMVAGGEVATVFNTVLIVVRAGDGDDVVRFDSSNGALPPADIDGGIGTDILTGGDGDDRIRGGEGNDILFGGFGNDVLLGEEGMDVIIWNDGDGSDFIEGGEGQDFVQVNGANGAGDDFSIDPNGERVRFRRTNLSLFTLDIGTTENLDVNGQGGSDVIIGSVGLNGLIGLDLDGGEGDDVIGGGDGPDVLRGGAGNDTLIGGRGNDVMLGGDDIDLMIWQDDFASGVVEGGEGYDVVRVIGSNTAGDDFSIDPNGQRVRVERTNLDVFTLDIGGCEGLDVHGEGGDDVIAASVGVLLKLHLDGGPGNDVLIGGSGQDYLSGSSGNDFLNGGPGFDFADGGPGVDKAIACERTINVE